MKRTRMIFPAATACLLLACEAPSDPATSTFPTGPAAAMNASALVAPSNAVAVAWGEKRIDLTWQDNSTNESGFEIHRSTTGEAGPFTLGIRGPNDVSPCGGFRRTERRARRLLSRRRVQFRRRCGSLDAVLHDAAGRPDKPHGHCTGRSDVEVDVA